MTIQREAGIAAVGYRRPQKLRALLESIYAQKPDARVSVFLNAPNGPEDEPLCEEVYKVAQTFAARYKLEIVRRQTHLPLDDNITGAVSQVLNEFSRIMLFEDDAHPKPGCLDFLLDSLSTFAKREDIFSIGTFCRPFNVSGVPPVFLSRRFNGWAWATWRDRWEKICSQVMNKQHPWPHPYQIPDIAGQDIIDYFRHNQLQGAPVAWDMMVAAWCMKLKWYQIQPKHSAIVNVGFDGSGTHCLADAKQAAYFEAHFSPDDYQHLDPTIQPERRLILAMRRNYDEGRKVSLFRRLKRRYKNRLRVALSRV